MKKLLMLAFCVVLVGCKTTIPSESISNSVISDLNAHTDAISILDKQIPKECKTDAYTVAINALKAQTDSIAGQVKSISQACKTEKEVLSQKITSRNIVIVCLLIVIVLYLLVKAKIILTGK